MLFIEVPDEPDSMSSITIDDIEYYVRFTYNEKHDYWSFGLYDEDENPIICMTRIVPNFPLLYFYTYATMPEGVFGCLSEWDEVGRDSFNDNEAFFVYIPYEDIEGGEEDGE